MREVQIFIIPGPVMLPCFQPLSRCVAPQALGKLLAITQDGLNRSKPLKRVWELLVVKGKTFFIVAADRKIRSTNSFAAVYDLERGFVLTTCGPGHSRTAFLPSRRQAAGGGGEASLAPITHIDARTRPLKCTMSAQS